MVRYVGRAMHQTTTASESCRNWFRHLLATKALRHRDVRSTIGQGGWLDERSVLGYAFDVPERRRQIVQQIDADTTTTRTADRMRIFINKINRLTSSLLPLVREMSIARWHMVVPQLWW